MAGNDQYYAEAINRIEEGELPFYHIDSKVRDLSCFLTQKEKSRILHRILKSTKSSEIFRYLNKNKALVHICWHLDALRSVPQDKGNSKNAFEHTLKVIELISPTGETCEFPSRNNNLLRWVALIHDLGKFDSYYRDPNFRNHQNYSYNISQIFTKLYSINNGDRISNIVKNHMFPLDYQRRPDWTDKAVRRFINRIGREDVLDTIAFSYYDKKSENDVMEYLRIIDELYDRVDSILRERI